MKKLNNWGFSLVEGLLTVIAICLVVGVGFYVYNSSVKKDKPKATVTVQKKSTKSTSNQSQIKYLKIPELGIKLELSDKLKNSYYVSKNGGIIYLSVHEIDSMKGFSGCIAGQGDGQDGIAAIDYAKVGDDHFGSPWTEQDLKNFSQTQIGETHYWIEPRSQAPCYDVDKVSQDDPNITALGSYKNALVTQGVTITKL